MSSYRMKYKIGLVEHSLVVPEDMSAVPIGTILPYGANSLNPPYGFLWCDGSAVSRTMYPDLFELIGTLYGSGDGSTTFNLPNLLGGRFLEGTDSAGTNKDAGIPNVKGTLRLGNEAGGSAWALNSKKSNGCFIPSEYTATAGTYITNVYRGEAYAETLFDASNSSSVYKNDITTVQPKSLTIRYIIRAYTGASPSANLDLSVYAQDLATRLQREQVPAFNKLESFTTSGSFTVPYTGWYRIMAKGGGGGGMGGYSNISKYIGGGGGGEGGLNFRYVFLEKDYVVSYTIGAGGTGGSKPTSQGVWGTRGTNGSNTVVVTPSVTVTAYGGISANAYVGGTGGDGAFPGQRGTCGVLIPEVSNGSAMYGIGGGSGYYGSGGNGGYGYSSLDATYAGSNGVGGFVWFEYFDPSL